MSTGLNGTPMPSFADSLTPEQRWAITDFIVSLSGNRRAWLHQPRRSPSTSRIRSTWRRARELRIRACGALSDRRADHGAGTRVPSSRDFGHRSGDLRCRLDRAPRSMARQERRENGNERAVAHRASGGGGGAGGGQVPRRQRSEPIRRRGSGARRRSRRPQQDPFAEEPRRRRPRHPSSPTPSRSRFLRSRRRAPASHISFSATARTRSISGSSIWPAPAPLQFTGKGSGDIAPNDTGDVTGVASYDQGEWSVIFKRPLRAELGRRRSPRRVPADRLLGLGRVLARAWQPARSHALEFALRRAGSRPLGRRPDGEDGAVHSRHRAGRDRLGAVASRLSRPRKARR